MRKINFKDRAGKAVLNLTDAVIQDHKTNTRRIIPNKTVEFILNDFKEEYYAETLDVLTDKELIEHYYLVEHPEKLPYRVGEIVAVAQAYKDVPLYPFDPDVTNTPGWTNKMYVRSDLMPHRIEITGIRIECLQDISDEDCMKEGIEKCFVGSKTWFKAYSTPDAFFASPSPQEAFAALIDKVSKKGTWDSNPYVFAYEFKTIR